MNRRLSVLTIALVSMLGGTNAALAGDFGFSFEWGAISKCTSGNPGRVPNPIFKLSGVPAGTASIKFKMMDLNAPDFNHGGGTVSYGGNAVIKPGAFKYAQPCPPGGSHMYVWTATALDAAGKKLATAKARKKYP